LYVFGGHHWPGLRYALRAGPGVAGTSVGTHARVIHSLILAAITAHHGGPVSVRLAAIICQ
jgi:hypothetical protein